MGFVGGEGFVGEVGVGEAGEGVLALEVLVEGVVDLEEAVGLGVGRCGAEQEGRDGGEQAGRAGGEQFGRDGECKDASSHASRWIPSESAAKVRESLKDVREPTDCGRREEARRYSFRRRVFRTEGYILCCLRVYCTYNGAVAMWEPEPCVLDLSDVIRLSDDDLLKICAANPDLRIEQNAFGQLEIMPPAGLSSSARESRVGSALSAWNDRTGSGIVFASSGGFRLPDGSMRAPDAAWLSIDKWDALSESQRERFAPVVPDFLVEIRSPTDTLAHLRAKMTQWMENGCRLAWLIDPFERVTTVYRAGGDERRRSFDEPLSGEDVLPGFSFDARVLP